MYFNLFSRNVVKITKIVIKSNIFYNKCVNQLSISCINNFCMNTSALENYMKKLEFNYKKDRDNLKAKDTIREIVPLVEIISKRNAVLENLHNLTDLLKEKDEDLKQLVEEEKQNFLQEIKEIDSEFVNYLLLINSKDDNCNSIVLEVSAGVGGQEAMLFANELFNMYCNFAEYKNWDCNIVELDKSEIGGMRHASAFIDGPDVFQYFKLEAGVHRVQRIPATEKSGRTHTSTVSVNALPQPDDLEVVINEKDIKIETKKASGAGGQHVNTTDSAVRILHIPTGIAVECQTDRSQIKNRQTAMQRLKAKLYQIQLDEQIANTEAARKAQVKSNFRNEKIRTYNFSQDRITDHRLQSTNFHNLKVFLQGGEPLETLMCKLRDAERRKRLNEILGSL